MTAESLPPQIAKNPSVGLRFLVPTILVIGGFKVRIRLAPREHGPAHVHVWKAGTQVIISLGDSEKAPAVRDVHGMIQSDVTRALGIVAEYQEVLLQRWREHHE